ncbi:MAG: hypothetical protein RMM17_05525 [Acidobacteriota bacterium]|nr:hypothetical protein [Blastocatellia bacterium]MDW8412125.1 hypothetical protein [Acidobacteriota bacterium]
MTTPLTSATGTSRENELTKAEVYRGATLPLSSTRQETDRIQQAATTEPNPQPTEKVQVPILETTLHTERVFSQPSQGQADPASNIVTFGGYYGLTQEPKGRLLKGFLIFFVPLVLLLAALAAVFIYVPALRQKLPQRIASLIGIKTSPQTPVATLQEYRVSVDPKENIATISGVLTNSSSEPLTALQIEILLFRREDIRQTEIRIIPLKPTEIAPGESATYELKVPARSYQQMKVTKVLSGASEIPIKRLEPVEKASPQDYESFKKLPAGREAKSEQIYEGSVTTK